MPRRPMVGLDIGTSAVRAAELTMARGGPVLQRFGQVGLPPGAVRDGEVVDVGEVSAAIRELWRQAKFDRKRVVIGVANQKVVVRQVELAWLPPKEQREALAYQVQEYIPIPVEQAILDYQALEEFTADNGSRMLRVLLVAAARDMVDSSLAAVVKAGLEPAVVDLTSFAVLRASAHAASGLGQVHAEALVDIGSSVTNIVVHQAGVARFVRILMMGGGDITDALSERLGLPVDQAESVKQTLGLAAVPGAAETQPANRAIELSGGSFVDEVRGSLDYYLSQPGAIRIERVVLSGGGAMLGGLAERLSSATRLPVDFAHPLALLRLGKTGLTEDELAYVEPMVSVPVGLALAAAS